MANPNNSNLPRPVWLQRSFRFAAYWFNLIVQPALAITFVVGLAWLFGYMQRNHNWFSNSEPNIANAAQEEAAQYACSMLCVFVKAPGRCPVCGMELQKIESQGDPQDIYGVTIKPTARRLANIETVAALNLPVSREFEALGQITYDETTEATVSARVDGRVENLFVNFTGAKIRKRDEVAVLYSPDLYADQAGLLQAKKALQRVSSNDRVNQSNRRLYESARRRLIELGLPASQVDQIEAGGKPNSRVQVYAPISGTVVDKLIEEGEYIKTGMPILKIADLSSVWLMLAMYPEDTSKLRIGQSVDVEIRSQVGTFEGRIAFIGPMVDAQTKTVDVRVEIPNEAGLIKIGDFGKAKIQSRNDTSKQFVVVPREAVLVNGSNSIAYVETEPGRFEFRKVNVAETLGDRILIADGIHPGEQVVVSGAFMLDSTFNIQGKASLIDPNRAAPKFHAQIAKDKAEAKEIEESFANLSVDDRALAEAQVICPVSEVRLGTMGMGTPINVDVNRIPVMICCEGCRNPLVEDPQKYLEILRQYKAGRLRSDDAENKSNSGSKSSGELPQMDLLKMESPEMELPPMEVSK